MTETTETETEPPSRATHGSSATTRPRSSRAGRRAGRSSACTRPTCYDDSRPKYYLLTMYPYPSGDLHIGHWYIVTPSDALARFRRMHGYNVFFPIGFDAFGLPAENAAIKNGGHPFTWTMQNIENMRRQFRTMGATFDWKNEVVTADPSYYRWNQWLFLRFLEAGPGLSRAVAGRLVSRTTGRWPASRSRAPTATAGAAARWSRSATWSSGTCGRPTYADELLDFSGIDWPEPIKIQQTNWIGRSEGAEIDFETAPDDHQPGGDRAARLHDPPGHPVRGDVHGPRPRASAGRRS